MSKKLTLVQRIIRAVWPTKRAEVKPKPGVCSECLQGFLGSPRQLTCGSKVCKRNRKNRLSAEKYTPLVDAIKQADPDIKVTVSEFK
jgi:hypothetical protein